MPTLSEQGHAVRLIIRTDQRGLSSAVLRGFFEAKGRVLVCMDADLAATLGIIAWQLDQLHSPRYWDFSRTPPKKPVHEKPLV